MTSIPPIHTTLEWNVSHTVAAAFGTIDYGVSDWVRLDVAPGNDYSIAVSTKSFAYSNDSVLKMYDSTGVIIEASENDFTSVLSYHATSSGYIYIAASDNSGYGGSYDFLVSTLNQTTLQLGSASDTYTGMANERIFGDEGAGMITLGSATEVSGGAGDDNIGGNQFDDHVSGGWGDDVIDLGEGNNVAWGGPGDDEIIAGTGNDQIFGDDGQDYISSNTGIDIVHGGAGGDSLVGWGDGSQLFGDDGNDYISAPANSVLLDGGTGADTMVGGSGNNTFIVDNAGDQVLDTTTGDADVVHASVSYVLTAGQDIETLSTNLQAGTAAINLTGNSLAQTIVGNAGANVLTGGGGTDTLQGLGGNDTYSVSVATTKVFEAISGGTDAVYSSVTYALQAGQEIEKLATNLQSGTSAINLTGNEFGQQVSGNAGVNIINGGLGNDHLFGGGAADTFVFNTAINAVSNLDHIMDFTPVDDTISLAHSIFAAIATGTLADAAFYQAAGAVAAHDADDRIVYNTTTGGLYYDADGNKAGGVAAVEFAILDNHASFAITHSDFLIA